MAAPSRKRYITLDAMRGIAALFIVARHFSGLHGASDPQFSFLAVDLFFLLSGFVLSFSYDGRFAAGMTRTTFLMKRIIRLYPLYLLGISVGIAIGLSDTIRNRAGAPSLGAFLTQALTGLAILPSPTWHSRPDTFPLLIPAWSLFLELYAANILFAAIKGRNSTKLAALLVLVSAAILIPAIPHYQSIGGGAHWSDFVGGFPRVFFSFFAGVLLQRLHRAHPHGLRVPSWMLLAALILVFSPSIPGTGARVYEAACVFVFFPALIFWGAEAAERNPRIGAMLGDTSYAVYVIHYPLVILTGRALGKLGIAPGYLVEFVFLGFVTVLAYCLHHFYDAPVRSAIARYAASAISGARRGSATV
jgi:peptidoglycan/LPS O-acetylase OafA/YrhL